MKMQDTVVNRWQCFAHRKLMPFFLVSLLTVCVCLVAELRLTETDNHTRQPFHLRLNDVHEHLNSSNGMINLKQPILTIFTSIKDRKVRTELHHRTLANWAALKPFIVPVLFIPVAENTTTKWRDAAYANGWEVRTTNDTINGVPILKSMFQDIQKDTESDFIAFANADILFDESLVRNLMYIRDVIPNVTNEARLLMVGRRRNANTTEWNLDVQNGGLAESAKRIELHYDWALDYFIISKRGLPWDKIPPFVVGRVGYDNWLAVMALEWDMTYIDASLTLLAVHQVGLDGVRSGFTTNQNDTDINKEMVKKKFNYKRGRTFCSPLRLSCSHDFDELQSFMCKFGDMRLDIIDPALKPSYCLKT